LKLRQVSEEVLYATEPITVVGPELIARLKAQAAANRRRRARLCAHLDDTDRVHEMLIVHARGAYVPPHKHLDKSESFHLIEGRLEVVVFGDQGRISRVVPLGEPASGLAFYYRLSAALFHTVLPRSDWVVFHETTRGPFNRAETVFAPWAPGEDDAEGQSVFLQRLERELSGPEKG